MEKIVTSINDYLELCEHRKRLTKNTVRAYRIDMRQFVYFLQEFPSTLTDVTDISKYVLHDYVKQLTGQYAPRTCKRKIASLKAFFNYLEFEDVIAVNPIRKVNTAIREPLRLPKSLDLTEMEVLLKCMYRLLSIVKSTFQRYDVVRCIAYLELLFATGLRVGELCSLTIDQINIERMQIRVIGKGGKERIVYFEDESAKRALASYLSLRQQQDCLQLPFVFLQWNGRRMTEDTARRNLRKYTSVALQGKHVTPHMIRHTFAILLLEEGVDIRYIQELLGHSSITTTQIYLRLTNAMLRVILCSKHPRKKITI